MKKYFWVIFVILFLVCNKDSMEFPVNNVKRVLKSENYELVEQKEIDIESFRSDVLKRIDLLKFQKEDVKLTIYVTEYTSAEDAMSDAAARIQESIIKNSGYYKGGGSARSTFNIKIFSETNNNKEVAHIFNKIKGIE